MNSKTRKRQLAHAIRLLDELGGGEVLILSQAAADKWNAAMGRLRTLYAELAAIENAGRGAKL